MLLVMSGYLGEWRGEMLLIGIATIITSSIINSSSSSSSSTSSSASPSSQSSSSHAQHDGPKLSTCPALELNCYPCLCLSLCVISLGCSRLCVSFYGMNMCVCLSVCLSVC